MTDASDWKETLEDLERRRQHALGMGGPDRLARHRAPGPRVVARPRPQFLFLLEVWFLLLLASKGFFWRLRASSGV